VILIGLGTGLAPLRGFIDERAAMRQEGVKVGKTLLFFGCRRPDHDYIYREDLEAHRQRGNLDGLYLAFSRLPDQPKIYVQDLIRKQAQDLWPLLRNGASVFVCGDARNMAPAVQKAIQEILVAEGGMTGEQAEQQIRTWRSEGRYCDDVWAST